MLSIRVRNWCVCWACASVSDAYTQHVLQFLVRMLSSRTSSWLVCSSYASLPDAHAQCTHQSLTRMLRVYKINIWKIQKLMRMLSMRVRNWCVCSGCTSVPDAHTQGAHQSLTQYAQRAHKGRSMRIRNSIYLKVPKKSKILKKSLLTLSNGLKSFWEKKILPKLKKNPP